MIRHKPGKVGCVRLWGILFTFQFDHVLLRVLKLCYGVMSVMSS